MNLATKKWVFLKLSSIILVPLMFWFIINFISVYDGDYSEVVSFFSNKTNKFLFSIFLIFTYFFSALSISEVFEDYIQNEKLKNVANRLLYLFAIIIPIITILILYNLTL